MYISNDVYIVGLGKSLIMG